MDMGPFFGDSSLVRRVSGPKAKFYTAAKPSIMAAVAASLNITYPTQTPVLHSDPA